MNGFFIVFEGLDGSGKGTILSETRKFLISEGIEPSRIYLTAEPTNGFYGKKLRELLKEKFDPKVNAKQFLDLYVADRKEHISKEILPALKDGKIILCDRYKYSTFVYQSLQGIPLEEIQKLHEGMPVPNLVLILDVPAETALKRISRRAYLEGFEKKNFMEKVREGFLSIKKILSEEKIFVIDSSESIGAVKSRVFSIIRNETDLL